ncbi:hypothetical protein [Bacillus altitudinis]
MTPEYTTKQLVSVARRVIGLEFFWNVLRKLNSYRESNAVK